MDPLRFIVELPGDLEAVRRLMLKFAPRLEGQQPGITQQLQVADLSVPMQMANKLGDVYLVTMEQRGENSAVKVTVNPPVKLKGKLRTALWRWKTRLIVRWTLKGVKKAIARERATGSPS